MTSTLDSNMNNKSLSIAVVAAVAVMLVATSAVATEDAFAGKKKKEYNQATSQANACGNGELPLNVGCQNVASQVQGDKNVVSQFADQVFPAFNLGNDEPDAPLPYCDVLAEQGIEGDCHDRFDIDDETGLYPCNDGTQREDPFDCPDASIA